MASTSTSFTSRIHHDLDELFFYPIRSNTMDGVYWEVWHDDGGADYFWILTQKVVLSVLVPRF